MSGAEGTDVPGGPDVADVTDAPDVPVRRASNVWRVLGRGASAIGVVAVTASVVVLGPAVPALVPTDVPASGVPVAAGESSWVCPGPLRVPTEIEPGDDAAYDPAFDPTPEATATRLAAVGTPDLADLSVLGGDDGPDLSDGTATASDVDAPLVLTAAPDDDGVPSPAAAAVAARTTEGDLRGLAAAACGQPAPETWLVGGSTALGSSARLVLQNPGRTPATVDVTVWGPSGPVETPGAAQHLVPPGEERTVLLEGVAAEQRRLVVRLRSAGRLVGGYLQDSELRGLVPAGVDLVVPGAAPATRQVVTGVAVVESPGGGADAAQLRLLAPDTDTRASVRLHGPDGPAPLPGAEDLPLAAGEVLDVALTGVPSGVYAVVVEADDPVVAGAMLTAGEGVGSDPDAADGRPLDRAWAPARAVTGTHLAVPAVGSPVLALSATGDRDRTAAVELVGSDGSRTAEDVVVPAGTTVTVDLREAADGERPVAVVVDGVGRAADGEEADTEGEGPAGGLAWSVVLREQRSDGGMVALLTPVPSPSSPPAVPVLVE